MKQFLLNLEEESYTTNLDILWTYLKKIKDAGLVIMANPAFNGINLRASLRTVGPSF